MEDNQVQQAQEVSEQTVGKVETTPQDAKEKTFTQDDVNSIVSKRVDKLNKQWEEKFNALEESIKLQSMSEAERQEHDYAKRLADLEAREQALKEKENAYNKSQYKAEIQRQLNEAGLPDVSDMLVSMDAEQVKAQIDVMKASFNAQVNASVEAKIKSSVNTPTVPQEQNRLLTLDEIKAMTTNEYMANRELVEKSLKALRK